MSAYQLGGVRILIRGCPLTGVLDIKDDEFNIGEIFTNNKVIRAAY